jgi:hypothetical protein
MRRIVIQQNSNKGPPRPAIQTERDEQAAVVS